MIVLGPGRFPVNFLAADQREAGEAGASVLWVGVTWVIGGKKGRAWAARLISWFRGGLGRGVPSREDWGRIAEGAPMREGVRGISPAWTRKSGRGRTAVLYVAGFSHFHGIHNAYLILIVLDTLIIS